MANIGGALKTFGEGLFELGKVKLNKEENEMAFMRQKALQEIGIQAQKDLQKQSQEFQGGLEDKRQAHDTELFGMNTAARAGEQERGFQHDETMEKGRRSFEISRDESTKKFQLDLHKADSVESIIRSTNAQLGDIRTDISSWKKQLITMRGESAEPEAMKEVEDNIAMLYAQQAQVRDAGATAVAHLIDPSSKMKIEAPMGSDARTRAMSRQQSASPAAPTVPSPSAKPSKPVKPRYEGAKPSTNLAPQRTSDLFTPLVQPDDQLGEMITPPPGFEPLGGLFRGG